jgi:hypothetical protein
MWMTFREIERLDLLAQQCGGQLRKDRRRPGYLYA